MVVFVQIREGGEAVGSDFFWFAAAVHFRVNGQCAATHGNDFALKGNNVSRENRELEIDAMEDKKNGVFRVYILRHSELGAF